MTSSLALSTVSDMVASACIFDIGRFRGTDGPGIRTIVFFKGCPLRCRWCSNPFGLSPTPQLALNEGRCTACGLCVAQCPTGAAQCHDGQVSIDRSRCTACGRCVPLCAARARIVTGQCYSVPELFAEVTKDAQFYRRSQGGVTLSGGEVLWQQEAAAALLRLCRKRYLDTCIETSAFGPWEHLETLARLCKLVFVDLKHIDPERHRVGCGVSNDLILQNIQNLAFLCAEVGSTTRLVLRLPLIPNFNCDEDALKGAAQFLAALPGAPEINLLPYHRLGAGKYAMLGEDYALADLPAPHQDDPLVQTALRLLQLHAPHQKITLGGEAVLAVVKPHSPSF